MKLPKRPGSQPISRERTKVRPATYFELNNVKAENDERSYKTGFPRKNKYTIEYHKNTIHPKNPTQSQSTMNERMSKIDNKTRDVRKGTFGGIG